eukprot:364013-Chlamydomonas_euryale.AAC.9
MSWGSCPACIYTCSPTARAQRHPRLSQVVDLAALRLRGDLRRDGQLHAVLLLHPHITRQEKLRLVAVQVLLGLLGRQRQMLAHSGVN